jgi:multidrug transporter EmrE-like cation transporter
MTINQILDNIYPLPAGSQQKLAECIREVFYPKGHILLHADKVEHKIYFIKKGIARGYAYQEENEITFWFGREGDAIVSMKSYVGNQKGYEDIAPTAYGWYAGFLVCLIISMGLLIKATQTLPIGTAYAVWTGIGAVGTVLVGIFVFKDPANFWRIFFIVTLIGSIATNQVCWYGRICPVVTGVVITGRNTCA